MTEADAQDGSPPVLVLAPLAGDADALAHALDRCGAPVRIAKDVDEVERWLTQDPMSVAMLVVTHEAASERLGRLLRQTAEREPDWAGLPVLFLLTPGRALPPGAEMLQDTELGASLASLDRPVRARALRQVARTQIALRRRQFQVGELMERLEGEKEHQRFLTRELRHRTGNALAVLQALFRLSARRSADLDDLVQSFSARLASLANAHAALSPDAGDEPSLAQLVTSHTSPYCADAGQLHLEGPEVHLPDQIGFDLSMIVHELATNAAKYGALSVPDGRVDVEWSREEDGTVALTWQERGGPEVTPPQRRGLGTDLIGGLNLGHGCEAEVEFRPEGLRWHCRLTLPR